MAESLLTSLLQTLDKQSISGIASNLGESEASVSRALESSTATIFGGMAAKSQDTGALRRVLDLLPGNLGDISWSHLVTALSSTASPLIAAGKRMVSEMFGSSDTKVASALGRQSGLAPGKASTLLALVGPMVMSFLSRKMRDEGMNISSLGSLLQRESGTIRSMLPSEVADQFWPRTMAASASPVVAQSVKRERSFPTWLPVLAIIAAALGLLWLFTHARRPVVTTTGTAERMANEAQRMANPTAPQTTPSNVNLHLNLPNHPAESRFIAFIRDPNAKVDNTSWFNFDRLAFDSGSATLRPQSGQQLDDIATILAAYPNVHVEVGGHADNTGNGGANQALSQARAETVQHELEARGIATDRIAVQGFGDQNPIADNATPAGRAENRCASLLVVQK